MRFDPVKFMHLVDGLEYAEVGMVSKMFIKIWQFGPMSEMAVRTLCRSHFEVVRTLMFEVDGGLSFEMLEEARAFGKRAHNQRVEAGIASASKRKETQAAVERPLNARSTSVLSISLSSSDSEKERASSKSPAGFEEFYSKYPIKKARGAAERAWEKVPKDQRPLCATAIEAQVKAHHFRGTDGIDYIPHAATWLNQRRYLDELTASSAARPAAPLTKEEARQRLVEIRKQNGIEPGGVVPITLMPKEVREVIMR